MLLPALLHPGAVSHSGILPLLLVSTIDLSLEEDGKTRGEKRMEKQKKGGKREGEM